ncbi:HD domain-containing protein [Clostridium sp. 'White wine YQ']|uniref:HD domain-containing protein n=1 Tax=Clostridium sp. 'White wine YQ' TaxID=3027474 RepID=UPI0023663337|nr:HD domain-containing protein [Clostridium sp. 'White wine YQ']MDD7796012.1 HD domain-containing protein [Clostridium sp. 'White wine YQ']
MFYRIKQFMWAIESIYKDIDDEYIKKYLDEDEKRLFQLLKKSDKQHSIRVAKDALEYIEDSNNVIQNLDKEKIVKIALLHDIGKIERPLNVIEKSLIVILDKVTSGKISRYSNFKIIDIYYNHPEKGYEILKLNKKYDVEFLKVIEEHHHKIKTSNEILEIIKYCDNKN